MPHSGHRYALVGRDGAGAAACASVRSMCSSALRAAPSDRNATFFDEQRGLRLMRYLRLISFSSTYRSRFGFQAGGGSFSRPATSVNE